MKRDFLRHIVNPLVAEYAGAKKLRAIEDIKKLIAEGELRYGFSAYGGSVEGLKRYIESKDFDLVIDVLKSNNALDLLEKILVRVKETYSDHPGLVAAVEKRLEEIRRGVSEVDRRKALIDEVEQSIGRLPGITVEARGKSIVVSIKDLGKAVIKLDDKYTLSLELSAAKEYGNYAEAVEALREIINSLSRILGRGKG